MKMLWDDGNLKAIGALKAKKTYRILIDKPVELITTDSEIYYATRSMLLRNNVEFKEFIINEN